MRRVIALSVSCGFVIALVAAVLPSDASLILRLPSSLLGEYVSVWASLQFQLGNRIISLSLFDVAFYSLVSMAIIYFLRWLSLHVKNMAHD